MYGSFTESPKEQLANPNGLEHLPGGPIPASYPSETKALGSFRVVQLVTLSPNSLKHTSAYAVKSSLETDNGVKKCLIFYAFTSDKSTGMAKSNLVLYNANIICVFAPTFFSSLFCTIIHNMHYSE